MTTLQVIDFPLTDRLWLKRASFGGDRISAEFQINQFSQGLQRFDIVNLIIIDQDMRQVSQGFQGFDIVDLIIIDPQRFKMSQGC